MKKSVIKKWTKVLKSGEYTQTKGKMANERGNSFCCLGVLTNEFCTEKNKDFDDFFTIN